MKFKFFYLLIALPFLFPASLHAQGHEAQEVQRPVIQKIEHDFLLGRLTLDQKVRYQFYALGAPQKLPTEYRSEKKMAIKCGTPAMADYQRQKTELSMQTKSEVEPLLPTPHTQAVQTYQSSSGKFTLYYTNDSNSEDAVPQNDENNNGVPDYVEIAAAAADSSYRHEVLTLGYTDPIPQGESYTIEILDLSAIYGQTYVNNSGGTNMQVENDFTENFPPNDDPQGDQIGALKVTIAHEFKHAIEYEANRWSGETGSWLEMTATLMEEVVFDNVNDYYNYLASESSIFNNPQDSFYPGSYYHVTWALYFEEQFGPSFWPSVWQIIKNNPQITMVNALTERLGSPEAFQEAYIQSQLWHYASGQNAAPNFGFEERTDYPTASISENESLFNSNFSIPRSSAIPSVFNFSARYYRVPHPGDVSGKVQLEVNSKGTDKGIGVIAYHSDGTVETTSFVLGSDENSFKMPNLQWEEIDNLGLIVTNASYGTASGSKPTYVTVGSDNYDTVTLNQNYPNPFNNATRIRFTLDSPTHVELTVFDAVGRKVNTLLDQELSAGLYEPVLNADNLASGIYFYRLSTDKETMIKKMTLVK